MFRCLVRGSFGLRTFAWRCIDIKSQLAVVLYVRVSTLLNHTDLPTVYINLPIGAVTIAVISVLLKLPHLKRKKLPLREQLNRLDPIGTTLFVPALVCLLLALQWGGTTYTWTSGIVVALLVVFVVLMMFFTVLQLWKRDNATIPPRIIKKRTVVASIWFTITTNGSQFVLIYLLPIWFQAIKGV